MEKSRRLEELSILNVFFCLLVVLIHVLSHPVVSLDKMSWQYGLALAVQRLSFVAVFGFFFLSGVKLTLPRSEHRTLGTYWLGRVKSVLLPYLLAAAVHYLYFIVIGWYTFDPGFFLKETALGTLSAHFYFVVTLLQFILLAPAFQALARRFSPVFLLPLAVAATLLSSVYLSTVLKLFRPGIYLPYIDQVAFTSYLVYYLAGCCAGEHYNRFLALLKENRPLLTACALFFGAADGILSVLAFSGRQDIPYLGLVHTLYMLSAIPALYSCAARARPLGQGRWAGLFRRVDRASYLIYLYHSLSITVFNSVAARLGITRTGTLLVLRALVVYTATIGGCILWQALWGALRKKLGRSPSAAKV